MAFHNGMFFSTFDRDNDRGSPYSCALAWLSGWWYNDCHRSNLNGEYGNTGGSKESIGITGKGLLTQWRKSGCWFENPDLEKKCERIKPYALCYATDMAFLEQTLRKRRVAKIMIFTYIFFVIDFLVLLL